MLLCQDTTQKEQLEQELYSTVLAHCKSAAHAESVCALAGRLHLSSSGWLILSVPNAVVKGLFDALEEQGVELPLKDGKLNAHISVMSPEEVAQVGGAEKISERGHAFKYNLGAIKTVKPSDWKNMAKVWFCAVKSPELQTLRKSYGLSPLPKEGKHEFHITFAVRKTGVLQHNETKKAAGPPVLGKEENLRFLPGQNPDIGQEKEEGFSGYVEPVSTDGALLPKALAGTALGSLGGMAFYGGSSLGRMARGGLVGSGATIGASLGDSLANTIAGQFNPEPHNLGYSRMGGTALGALLGGGLLHYATSNLTERASRKGEQPATSSRLALAAQKAKKRRVRTKLKKAASDALGDVANGPEIAVAANPSFAQNAYAHLPKIRLPESIVGGIGGAGLGYLMSRKKNKWRNAFIGALLGAGATNLMSDRARRYISNTTPPVAYVGYKNEADFKAGKSESKARALLPDSFSKFYKALIQDKPVYDAETEFSRRDFSQDIHELRRELFRRGLGVHTNTKNDYFVKNVDGSYSVNPTHPNVDKILPYIATYKTRDGESSIDDSPEYLRNADNLVRAINQNNAYGLFSDVMGGQVASIVPFEGKSYVKLRDRWDYTLNKAEKQFLHDSLREAAKGNFKWFDSPTDKKYSVDYSAGKPRSVAIGNVLNRYIMDKYIVDENPWITHYMEFPSKFEPVTPTTDNINNAELNAHNTPQVLATYSKSDAPKLYTGDGFAYKKSPKFEFQDFDD